MRMHINVMFQVGEQSQLNMKAVASYFNSVRGINEQNISVAQIAIEPFDSNTLASIFLERFYRSFQGMPVGTARHR